MPHHRSGGGKLSHGTAGSLQQRVTRAPDGGSWENYRLGHRFLPEDMVLPDNYLTGDGSVNANMPAPDGRTKTLGAPYTLHEIMLDRTHVDSDRSKAIKVTSFGLKTVQALKDLHNSNGNNPQAQKVIDDGYHKLILAPQIKAREEAAQKKREEALEEYNRLKMRVQELETQKRPTPELTVEPTPVSYLPLGVIAVVVIGAVLLLRRRA